MLNKNSYTRFWNFWMILLFLSSTSWGFYVDYYDNAEVIKQRAGSDVTLQCNLKGLVSDENSAYSNIRWLYKQCSNEMMASCQNFKTSDWIQLPCEENICKPVLYLKNVTEKYSGLYKCTFFPYRLDDTKTMEIQLVRTYQLDVKNFSFGLPDFLDSYPLNKTTVVGNQVLLQCRVHSEDHPTIRWFRRISDGAMSKAYSLGTGNFNTHIVKHNNYTYELIHAGLEKHISDEIYLSKLILNNVRLQDEGFYACVAITYRGHRIRESYLKVYAQSQEYWSEYDGLNEFNTDPAEFGMLFLIPLCLALLPISVWLIYIALKKYIITHDINCANDQFSDDNILGNQWR